MRIRTIGVPVQDQEVALTFYTEKLGFIKNWIPAGWGAQMVDSRSPGRT